MDIWYKLGLIAFAGSISALGMFFVLNPFLIGVSLLFLKKKDNKHTGYLPSVSIVTVVRNGRHLIQAKIENALSLDYPLEKIEVLIYSDGSTDGIEEAVRPYLADNVRFYSTPFHEGKNAGLNRAVLECAGEIIVFSDADALFQKDALSHLVRPFSDPDIGGVCGRRLIAEKGLRLSEAQDVYIRFDTFIKKLEGRSGSISSNDGKICAVRKGLYRPIPEKVTDDLYVALSVIRQKYRFVFEPEALAFVRLPSRSPYHEVERRRRIVGGSMTGIWLLRELLNPFRYGPFSVNLFVNKVLRRLLPVFLIVLFFSSMALSFSLSIAAVLFLMQGVFYTAALLYHVAPGRLLSLKQVARICSVAYYFCLGNYGTLRGVIDFLRGNQVVRWTPAKGER